MPVKSWTAAELDEMEFPPPDWLVKGLWTHGDKIVMVGESRSFKSWIMADLVIHLAACRDWAGFTVPTQRKVVYVDEEMSLKLATRRMKRLAQGAGIEFGKLPLVLLSQQGIRIKLGAGPQLLKDLGAFDPNVIVFDTLLQVLEGNVNENTDVATFWNRLKPLIDGGKRSVFITHHLTKPGDPSMPQRSDDHRTLGAGYILGGADAHCSLTRKTVQEVLSPSTTAKFWKNRDGLEASAFELVVKDLGPHDKCVDGQHLCPATIVKAVKTKPMSHPGAVTLYSPLPEP